MFRSEPTPTIQNAMQLTIAKLVVAYSYSTNGVQSNQASIKFYGINKSGKNLIATATLDTDSGYIANDYASCIIERIPVEEYPYIVWELENPSGSKFVAIHGNPQVLLSVNGGVDHIDSSVIKIATKV